MSTEARCRFCSKLLGTLDTPTELTVSLQAATADAGTVVFTVKCPRCGKTNHITFVSPQR